MAVTLNASTSSGFIATSDTSGEIALQGNGTNVATFTSTAANLLVGGSSRLSIDSSGRVLTPGQSGFMASIAIRNDVTYSQNTVLPFNTTANASAFNTGNNFNTGTYLYTAPVAGKYFFSFTLYMTNSGGANFDMQAGIAVNGVIPEMTGSDAFGVANANPSLSGPISVTTSVILNLAANDNVGVRARTPSGVRIYAGHSFFTGYLLG